MYPSVRGGGRKPSGSSGRSAADMQQTVFPECVCVCACVQACVRALIIIVIISFGVIHSAFHCTAEISFS